MEKRIVPDEEAEADGLTTLNRLNLLVDPTRIPFGVLALRLNGTRKLDDFHPKPQQPHPLQSQITNTTHIQ